MKYKVGDKVKYIKNEIWHSSVFSIGDVLEIVGYGSVTPRYRCKNKNGIINFFEENELELIEKKPFKFEIDCEKHYIFPTYDLTTTTPCLTTYDNYEDIEKENKNMNCNEILNIYKDRKSDKIYSELDKERQKIYKEDAFQNLNKEYVEQFRKLYKNEFGESKEFIPPVTITADETYTAETQEKLLEISKKEQIAMYELKKMLQEVRAQLEIVTDYDVAMKILKRYDILGKDYKINA